jgi:hypothetical protein
MKRRFVWYFDSRPGTGVHMKRLLAVSGLLLAAAAGVTAPAVSASAATSQANQYCVIGPDACSANVGYPIGDSRPADNGLGDWGISSWHAWANCWRTEIFTDYDYNGLEYNYAQGEFEAAQVGEPRGNHIWSLYTFY